MLRATPAASLHRIGEPEKPGPTPVASTAGPDTRTRIRAPELELAPRTTSITSAENSEMAVPRMTDRAVQLIPGRTWESGMIGSCGDRARGDACEGREDRRERRQPAPHGSEANRRDDRTCGRYGREEAVPIEPLDAAPRTAQSWVARDRTRSN